MHKLMLSILALSSCLAGAQTFEDMSGVHWRRHMYTERRTEGRTLLLAVDEPLDAHLLPKVIARRSFAASESAELTREMLELKRVIPMSVAPDLTPTNNPLWPIDHPWSEQDELDYDDWIKRVASPDLLVGGGVEVDCADFAIALRWIYAHDHHLPAGDTLTAGKGLFGSWQSTDDWDKLATNADWKKDERFKAALRYVLTSTFTHTVFTDLYPVAITPEYVSPGTVYLTLETQSGHTRTIFNVGPHRNCQDKDGCILIIWGNEPASEQGYINELVPYWLAADSGGFLRFRWPEQTASGWQLRAPDQMRGYSNEQYAWPSAEYLDDVAARLHLWNTPESRLQAAASQADRLLVQRLSATRDGFLLCSLVPCSPNDSLYTDFSTPVRDHAIALAVQNLQTLIAKADPASPQVKDLEQRYDHPVFGGSPYSEYELLTGNYVASFNSDPRVDFFTRWGVPNLTSDQRIWELLDQLNAQWTFARWNLVQKAQEVCFPNGGAMPTCDPADPRVQKLSTARFDQGLRELRKLFLATLALTSQATQQNVLSILPKVHDSVPFCGPQGDQNCALDEYIIGPVDHWARMTSNAVSPLKARLGF